MWRGDKFFKKNKRGSSFIREEKPQKIEKEIFHGMNLFNWEKSDMLRFIIFKIPHKKCLFKENIILIFKFNGLWYSEHVNTTKIN